MKKLSKKKQEVINELESIMNDKIQKRSKLNYEITHLQESIFMVKEPK